MFKLLTGDKEKPKETKSKHPFHDNKGIMEHMIEEDQKTTFRENMDNLTHKPREMKIMTEQGESVASSSVSSETTNNSVDYFDEFIQEGEAAQAEAQEQQAQIVADTLTPKDEWIKGIIEGMEMAGGLTGQTWLILPNAHVTREQMENTLAGDYDLILKFPRFHWILKPSTGWLEYAFLAVSNIAIARGLALSAAEFNAVRIKEAKAKKAEAKPPKFEDVKEAAARDQAAGDNGYNPAKMNQLFNGGGE